jgi:hypothetical protein
MNGSTVHTKIVAVYENLTNLQVDEILKEFKTETSDLISNNQINIEKKDEKKRKKIFQVILNKCFDDNYHCGIHFTDTIW